MATGGAGDVLVLGKIGTPETHPRCMLIKIRFFCCFEINIPRVFCFRAKHAVLFLKIMNMVLKSEYLELFKDGANEGE